MTDNLHQTVHVLLVEDNDIDREAVRRAFRKHRILNPIVEATDGVQALEILRGEGGRDPLPRPHIVLLDLNMPRMNGIETLQALRADPDLHNTVVFVLTTSNTDEDRTSAYDLNVAGYIAKASVGAGFVRLIELLDVYWKVVALPGPSR